MSDTSIDKVVERLRTWASGHTDYGHQAATDALSLISDRARLKEEVDSLSVTIQEWAMSEPQVEIANLQIAASDLTAENEKAQKRIAEFEQKVEKNEWEQLQAELSKAQEKIKELEEQLHIF